MELFWRVKFVERPEKCGHEMYIYRETQIGIKEFMIFPKMLEFQTIKAGDEVSNGLYLSDDLFQKLVDSVHKDFKPSEGKFTEGKLEATEKHLEDMRKLVFTPPHEN